MKVITLLLSFSTWSTPPGVGEDGLVRARQTIGYLRRKAD
jgi:hypothetical protein